MMNSTPGPFPLLGKWKIVKVVQDGAEVAEPAQEVEFLPDGGFVHLLGHSLPIHVHRFKGTYVFTPPDRLSITVKEGREIKHQFTVDGDDAVLQSDLRTNYITRISETEFTEPVIDGWRS